MIARQRQDYGSGSAGGPFGGRSLTLRGAPVTTGFLILIAAIEVLTTVWDGLISDGLRLTIANDFAPIFVDGAFVSPFYTLMTSALLHGFLTHMIVNSVMIAIFGPPVERTMGSAPYAVFLVLLAIGTVLANWGWVAVERSVSDFEGRITSYLVGASGVACGLIALDVCARAAAVARIPKSMRGGLREPHVMILQISALMIGVNALIMLMDIGFGGVGISGAGHIGGYVTGLALAAPMLWLARQRARRHARAEDPASHLRIVPKDPDIH